MFLARVASCLTWRLANKPRHTGKRIPVLIYHRLLPEYIEDNNPIYTVLPEQFESQMAFLKARGFETLSLQEYAEIARGLRQPPARSVLITFDDGYADNYRIAWPIAAKFGIKLNLFICTRLVGLQSPVVMTLDGYLTPADSAWPREVGARVQKHLKKFPELWRPLSWEELAEMRDSEVHLGFHSHSHRNLALLSPEEIALDTASGMALFAKHLAERPRFFAFPYGGFDSYTPQVISAVAGFGPEMFFAAHLGRARLPSTQRIFPRLSIYQEDNLAVFQRKLWGEYDWFGQIQRFEQRLRLARKSAPFHRTD